MNPLGLLRYHGNGRHSRILLGAIILAAVSGVESRAQTDGPTPFYRWTTLAGHPTTGYVDGPASEALFNNPRGIAIDTDDNIYVADTANHVIRKISAQGLVTTLAGSPGNPGSEDGIGSGARFAFPKGVCVDAAANVYVADTENQTLRKITPTGEVTTLAGKNGETGDGTGPLETIRFNYPHQFFSDKVGNIYFGTANSFRRITADGIEDVPLDLDDPAFYEDGKPTEAVTARIMAVDWDGNCYIQAGVGTHIYGSNPGSPKIRRIVKLSTDGTYSILATSEYGSGKPYLSNSFDVIRWANDSFGNVYYVTRLISSIIVYEVYRITPDGNVEAAPWQTARRGGYADEPISLSADSHGNVLHLAPPDDVVYKTENNQLVVLAGTPWSNDKIDGTGSEARFANITGLAVNDDAEVVVGDSLSTYNVDYYASAAVRKITAAGLTSTLYTSSSLEGQSWTPAIVAVGSANSIYLGSATYGAPTLTKISSNGSGSSISTGIIRTMGPMSATADGQIYLAEPTRLNRRSPSGDWSVMAGADTLSEIKDGVGAAARFYRIMGLTVASNGDCYALDDASIAPEPRVLIRKITPNLAVTTVNDNLIRSGNAKPVGMTLDAKGDFVLTYSDDTVRLLNADGTLHVIGGLSGSNGTRDGLGSDARFYLLRTIATDANNHIYVTDNAGTTVRKGEFLGYNATITSQPQSLTVETGATAVFSVTAQGTLEPSYQWYFNDAGIAGATTSTLTISNAQTTNAGSYTVTVGNSLGTVTSAAATLTVTTPTTPPPTNGGGSTPPPPTSDGSSGGGGAPSIWFIGALAALFLIRCRTQLAGSRA
jgi:hypothetical protein